MSGVKGKENCECEDVWGEKCGGAGGGRSCPLVTSHGVCPLVLCEVQMSHAFLLTSFLREVSCS